MRTIFFLSVLVAFLITGSCGKSSLGEKFYTINIDNNSAGIVYFYAYDEFSEIQYPDTVLPSTNPGPTKLGSGARFYIRDREPWAELINELSSDTLSIFFFADNTYEDSSWSAISNQYLILKRYDLSIEDLERINFKVPYPPDETMEGIQMYPPE